MIGLGSDKNAFSDISLCWHQFDWRARGWLCRPWRPPCHCWPLSSRSKHSSLRALSPQSVSPVLTWPTGTIHHLTLRSASSSLRQTLFKWGRKKFHTRNPSKQNKYLRYKVLCRVITCLPLAIWQNQKSLEARLLQRYLMKSFDMKYWEKIFLLEFSNKMI